jgi:hypothetical protein
LEHVTPDLKPDQIGIGCGMSAQQLTPQSDPPQVVRGDRQGVDAGDPVAVLALCWYTFRARRHVLDEERREAGLPGRGS